VRRNGPVPEARSLSYTAELVDFGPALKVELSHPNPALLERATEDVQAELNRLAGVFDVKSSLKAGKREEQSESLVMIDFIIERMDEDWPAREAIVDGAKTRFRPILLTLRRFWAWRRAGMRADTRKLSLQKPPPERHAAKPFPRRQSALSWGYFLFASGAGAATRKPLFASVKLGPRALRRPQRVFSATLRQLPPRRIRPGT